MKQNVAMNMKKKGRNAKDEGNFKLYPTRNPGNRFRLPLSILRCLRAVYSYRPYAVDFVVPDGAMVESRKEKGRRIPY